MPLLEARGEGGCKELAQMLTQRTVLGIEFVKEFNTKYKISRNLKYQSGQLNICLSDHQVKT